MKLSMPLNTDRNTAISHAVSSFLNTEQTALALRLWQDKYADKPNLSVQYFARECSNLFGKEAGRSQLVKNLVRELYTKLHSLDHIEIRSTKQ